MNRRKIPLASWLLILLAAMSLLVGGVAAYLHGDIGAVRNDFAADEASDPAVIETFQNDEKTAVKVDVGDPGYAVYVRAAVVVTWKDKDGNVLGVAPRVSEDYTMDVGTAWFLHSDGYYYHRNAVFFDGEDAASRLTGQLIASCKPVAGKTPEGYGLNVEIIAQTIQALGTTDGTDLPAVTDAWHVAVVDGKLTPPGA